MSRARETSHSIISFYISSDNYHVEKLIIQPKKSMFVNSSKGKKKILSSNKSYNAFLIYHNNYTDSAFRKNLYVLENDLGDMYEYTELGLFMELSQIRNRKIDKLIS